MVRKLFRNKIFVFLMTAAAAAFVFLQFIPQDEALANPPVVREPNWDSAETRALAKRACFDCHSNETKWPLYSKIAPVSWQITRHVTRGRKRLNFSEWQSEVLSGDQSNEVDERIAECIEEIEEGSMPLKKYLQMHKEAQLTDEQKSEFIDGLRATH